MAKAAPGFWAVWLWKLGMWGLVILFAVFYLGSVERHRDVIEGESVAAEGPTGAYDVGAGGGASVVDLVTQTAVGGVEPASAEPDGPSQVEMPVSTPFGTMSAGSDQARSGPRDPISESVSQAEAQAFAKAVMSDTDAESADASPAHAVGGAPGQLVIDAVVSPVPVVQPPVQSQMAGVSRPEADVPSAAVDGSQVAVPETAAQRRARIMGEYRAMQRAAQEKMRNRWSSMGRGYPYGAYPQWGYPPGMPPGDYGPAGQQSRR